MVNIGVSVNAETAPTPVPIRGTYYLPVLGISVGISVGGGVEYSD